MAQDVARIEDEESALLAALRRGENDGYARLVNDHAGRLLAVARRMLRNEDDAQEAVQEAFLSAFRNIGDFKAESRLGTWLHRIVVNACLMRIRARRRRPEMFIDDLLPRHFDSHGHHHEVGPQWNLDPDHRALDDETRGIVYDAMARLPEDYRNVLLLRDIEELSTREAAEVLETTEGAVKVRLHRARLALRELIDSHVRGDLS